MRAPIMTLTSAFLTLAMAAAYVTGSDWPVARRLEGQLLDLRFQMRGAALPSRDITLIAVDENQRSAHGCSW